MNNEPVPLQNKCQLITYPDSLGRNLRELEEILEGCFRGAVGGLHLLPFYPSSGDRGFAPLTYETVDPRFGGWEDVERLGGEYDLIIDFMVNHVSRESAFFKDFEQRGADSPYAGMFIDLGKICGDERSLEEAVAKVFRRKPSPPYMSHRGRKIWCTFGEQQVDIDVESDAGWTFITESLRSLAQRNIKMVRLDAIGYAVKRLGSECFMVQPETSRLLQRCAALVAPRGIEVLPEVHAEQSVVLGLVKEGYRVYDFNLPLLVLHALYQGTSKNLVHWLRTCPRKQVTTLDTHDGLPVFDVKGLLSPGEIEQTKEHLFSEGCGADSKYSLDPDYCNWNLYQLNSSYYSALSNDDDAYLCARAIQFFTPGIPQVYYMGLLAGSNDTALADATKLGRNLNRHNYTLTEAIGAAERPVVQRLLRLMRFRNDYPAFDGACFVKPSASRELVVEWSREQGAERAAACLWADLKNRRTMVRYRDLASGRWEELVP